MLGPNKSVNSFLSKTVTSSTQLKDTGSSKTSESTSIFGSLASTNAPPPFKSLFEVKTSISPAPLPVTAPKPQSFSSSSGFFDQSLSLSSAHFVESKDNDKKLSNAIEELKEAKNFVGFKAKGTIDLGKTYTCDTDGAIIKSFLANFKCRDTEKSVEEYRKEDYDFLKLQRMKCKLHKEHEADQYCTTCDKLICHIYSAQHSNFHRVESISAIYAKMLQNWNQMLKEAKRKEILLDIEMKLKKGFTGELDKVKSIQNEVKERICGLIDRIFDAELKKKMKKPLDEIDKLKASSKKVKAEINFLEKKIDGMHSLAYEEKNYLGVCEIYKELLNQPQEEPDFTFELKELDEKLKQYEVAELAQDLKQRIEAAFDFTFKCSLCSEHFIDSILEKACHFPKRLCIDCTTSIDQICWTNGTRRFTGRSNSWIAFCSNKRLPLNFKCKIKIHNKCIEDTEQIFIGISSDLRKKASTWFGLSNNGKLYKCGKIIKDMNINLYGEEGDVVSIVCNEGKLMFEINGLGIGVVVENVKGPFYLACADRSDNQYDILDITVL
eukprot:TRINITY_DN9458_c0_g2_i1.p1 TRINITY_DN9458_c0_g2~~TRINITY_DN9458_c0_g2_i1.p1  ORF type:complete len:551 (-),score=55.11 TRINITY_DN9458_c0_g2_i1:1180-2832(-)